MMLNWVRERQAGTHKKLFHYPRSQSNGYVVTRCGIKILAAGSTMTSNFTAILGQRCWNCQRSLKADESK